MNKNKNKDKLIYVDGGIRQLDKIFPFQTNNLYVLENPGLGSCLFYSIIQGIYSPFYELYDEKLSIVLDQQKFIKKFREELSIKLNEKVNPSFEESLTWYETLSRGKLKENSKLIPEIKNKNLINILTSDATPDFESEIFIEFISEIMDIDIYILDSDTKDVMYLDEEIYYKGRKSIILYHTPNHFELVMYKDNNDTYETNFLNNHKVINSLKERFLNKKS